MDFQDAPVIPVNNIYRERRIGRQAGNSRLLDLVEQGRIRPISTPTGQILLTPRDGETLFDALGTPSR